MHGDPVTPTQTEEICQKLCENFYFVGTQLAVAKCLSLYIMRSDFNPGLRTLRMHFCRCMVSVVC